MMQAPETAEAAATAVCDVSYSTPDKAADHQQDCAGVGVLPAAAGVHCGPLHQLPGLRMVTYLMQLNSPPAQSTLPAPHTQAINCIPSIVVT